MTHKEKAAEKCSFFPFTKPLTFLQGYALVFVFKCVTLLLFLLMFEKLVLNIDDFSVDGAGCHPPPFLLKDGSYVFGHFSAR